MSALAFALWATSNESERASLIAWALRGESIARIQGATIAGASDLTVSSPVADVSAWADRYDSMASMTTDVPPLSVLWAGQSILQGDSVVQEVLNLLRGDAPPAWSAILAALRPSRPALADALSQWEQPRESVDGDRVRRAWWWRAANRRPMTHGEADPPPAPTPPAPTPSASSSSPPWVLLAALAALVVSRARRRR